MGIEPTLVAWEATVLPLNYTRAALCGVILGLTIATGNAFIACVGITPTVNI
jgi:hypothetical protein